jgi:uncharacterized protein YbjT (DUF2867 family)
MILVTGATGNVGRNVVRQLLDEGEKVRAVARDELPLPDEVEVITGDLADPEVLQRALSGVERAFLFPVIEAVEAFLAAASHLKHIVMLSTAAVTFAEPGFVGQRHQGAEQAVRDSGLPWTFVRPNAFMANDLTWASQVREGAVRRSFGEAATAPVDERDVAAVIVKALQDTHIGRIHTLTGPESLTQAERVRIIGEVLEQPLRYVELPVAETREYIISQGGLAPGAIDFGLNYLATLVGTTAEVLSAVEQITGRPARTYAEWVAHRSADLGAVALQ